MPPETFACFYVTKDESGTAAGGVAERPLGELPAGDVLIEVAYSSLNYKDALSATGSPGVTKDYPHVPGIDAAGVVAECSAGGFSVGDEVVVTGFEMGAGQWGGYGRYVRVPAEWVVPKPEGLTLRECMIFGTAGFTAAIGVEAIETHGLAKDAGPVVVSGASGGVGTLAVAMLSQAGYGVTASTGKADTAEWLKGVGAAEVVGRDALADDGKRPLLRGAWAGAIDTVGGATLSHILRSTMHHGCVTCCGMVGGNQLELTVFPFILRGVQLVGLDSATYVIGRRTELWRRMATDWKPADLEALVAKTVGIDGLAEPIADILQGKIRGRVLVEHA